MATRTKPRARKHTGTGVLEVSRAAGPEVPTPDRADRVPPREAPGGRTPADLPAAPYRAVELDGDRFKLVAPVTLDDMTELQRRVREHGGGSVEVYCNVGSDVVIDVRWPNGARLTRKITPVS